MFEAAGVLFGLLLIYLGSIALDRQEPGAGLLMALGLLVIFVTLWVIY